jgi:hypothetical protein
MKCLSLRQPYAELLVSGQKIIELRKWNTKFRGKFLVHASKNVNREKCESLDIDHTKLSSGMIIGMAILYDVKKYDNRTQFMRDKNRHYAEANFFDSYMYGFKIKNAQRLRHPIPFSGKLGFFEVDQTIINITRSSLTS